MESEDLIKRAENIEKEIFCLDTESLKQENINDILNMTEAQFLSCSADMCDQMAISLHKHCIFAQSRINGIKAARDYLVSQMRRLVAPELRNYKGVSWDYAEVLAIQNSEQATQLSNRIQEYDFQLAATNNIVRMIENVAKRIEGMKYDKTKQRSAQ